MSTENTNEVVNVEAIAPKIFVHSIIKETILLEAVNDEGENQKVLRIIVKAEKDDKISRKVFFFHNGKLWVGGTENSNSEKHTTIEGKTLYFANVTFRAFAFWGSPSVDNNGFMSPFAQREFNKECGQRLLAEAKRKEKKIKTVSEKKPIVREAIVFDVQLEGLFD